MDEKNEGINNDEKKPDGEESGSNKFLVIGIIVAAIIINAIIAILLINATKPESEDQRLERMRNDSLRQIAEEATVMGATTAEAPIEAIVNIAGTKGERFLKAEVIFEYDNKAFPNLGEELIRRTPKIKDLLINHLSRQTLDELTEPDAKDKIRKDLVRLINATVPPKIGEVREVLFTTYIIQ